MSANVLPFSQQPQAQNEDTPRPVNFRPDVGYLRLNIVDEAYLHIGYRPGTVFIAQADKIVDGSLHYVELQGHGFFATIRDDLTSLYIMPLDGHTAAGLYGRLELEYIGAIVEAYPQGVNGPRWLLDLSSPCNATLPAIEAIAK